jgi:hypothetical protein
VEGHFNRESLSVCTYKIKCELLKREREKRKKMPALIGVSEFVEETTSDYKSPITSSFVSRMQNMKQTIATLEEVSATKEKSIRINIPHAHSSSSVD